MATHRLPSNRRKLLVAAVGVAAISYVGGCTALDGGESPSSGNLMAYPGLDVDAAPTPTPTPGFPPYDASPTWDAATYAADASDLDAGPDGGDTDGGATDDGGDTDGGEPGT